MAMKILTHFYDREMESKLRNDLAWGAQHSRRLHLEAGDLGKGWVEAAIPGEMLSRRGREHKRSPGGEAWE